MGKSRLRDCEWDNSRLWMRQFQLFRNWRKRGRFVPLLLRDCRQENFTYVLDRVPPGRVDVILSYFIWFNIGGFIALLEGVFSYNKVFKNLFHNLLVKPPQKNKDTLETTGKQLGSLITFLPRTELLGKSVINFTEKRSLLNHIVLVNVLLYYDWIVLNLWEKNE